MADNNVEKPIFPSSFHLGQDQLTRAIGMGDPSEYGRAQQRKINIIEGDVSQRLSRSQGWVNRYLYRDTGEGAFSMIETLPSTLNPRFILEILDRNMEIELPVISQGYVPEVAGKPSILPWMTEDEVPKSDAWYSIIVILNEAVDKLADIWHVTHAMLTGSGEKIECNTEEYRRIMSFTRGRISEYFDHRLRFADVDYKIMVLDHGGKTRTYQPVIKWQTGHNGSVITFTVDYPQIPDRYKHQQRSAELEYKLEQFLCWLLSEVNDQNTGESILKGVSRDRLAIMTTELRLSTDEMIDSLIYRLLHQMELPLSERMYSKLTVFTMCVKELFTVYSDVRNPMMPMKFTIDVSMHDLPLIRDAEFANSFFNPPFHKAHAGTTKVTFLPVGTRKASVNPTFSFLALDYDFDKNQPAIMEQDYTDVQPTIGAPTQAFGPDLCIPRDRDMDVFYPVSGEFTGLEATALRQGLLDQHESKKTLIINRDHPYPLYPITLDGFTAALVASNVSILDGQAQFPMRYWHKDRLTDGWM